MLTGRDHTKGLKYESEVESSGNEQQLRKLPSKIKVVNISIIHVTLKKQNCLDFDNVFFIFEYPRKLNTPGTNVHTAQTISIDQVEM